MLRISTPATTESRPESTRIGQDLLIVSAVPRSSFVDDMGFSMGSPFPSLEPADVAGAG